TTRSGATCGHVTLVTSYIDVCERGHAGLNPTGTSLDYFLFRFPYILKVLVIDVMTAPFLPGHAQCFPLP
ncbi:hypothetical protein BgiMline_032056, partial [Biomphalaria glabrata]